MENIILLVLGIVISALGVVNMTGNISTIHSYHRRRVSEEDIPKYGKWMGLGTLTSGISLIIGFVLLRMDQEALMGYCVIAGLVIGVALMLYAQFKYNRGLF